MVALGQATIYGAILKKDVPFRASHIVSETGMSRQLCYHHLTQLSDQGYLEKEGKLYKIADREGLIESLVTLQNNATTGLLTEPRLYLKDYKMLNNMAEIIVYLKSVSSQALH